jgi:hypothetical protein
MVADLDSDGEQDIIVWDDSKLMIFDKNLNEIKNETVGELAGHFTVVDFDGDSSVDDIVAIVVNNDTTANFTVFSFDGSSISADKNFILTNQSLGTNHKVANIKCADFDSDSDLDCLYKDWKGIVHSYDNSSASESDDDLNIDISGGGDCIKENTCYHDAPSFKDFDNDGDVDTLFIHAYFSSYARVSVTTIDKDENMLQIDLDTSFVDCGNTGFDSRPQSYFTKFADVIGDNGSEIIAIQYCSASWAGVCKADRYSDLSVYQNNGSLLFNKKFSTITRSTYDIGCQGAQMRDPLITDFDSDGKQDIQILYPSYNYFAGSSSNWFTEYTMISYNGTGTTLSSSSIEVPYPEKDYIMKGRGATFADMDGDGEYDWITPGGILDQNSEIISNFSLSDSSITYAPIPVDVDGNNLLDLVWSEDDKTKLLKPSPVQITDFRVAQVVEDVDLVKDKSTLVRLNIKFFSNESNQTDVDVNLYLNGSLEDSDSIILNGTEDENVSLWFTPDVAGTDLEIKAVAVNNFTGTNLSSTKTVYKDVIETRDLKVIFVPVDNPQYFESTVKNSLEFIQDIYPLSEEGLIGLNQTNSIYSSSLHHSTLTLPFLLNDVQKSGMISGLRSGIFPDKVVGVVEKDWFEDVLLLQSGTIGYSIPLSTNAVLVEDGYRQVSAHEIGHTYGLCDEYDEGEWDRQNGYFLDLCPNGDLDGDGNLDTNCEPEGCPTNSFYLLSGEPDGSTLYNFMGNGYPYWISKNSYEHLFDKLKIPSHETASSRILVSGVHNKSNNVTDFNGFYVFDGGFVHNESYLKGGNFSLEILDSGESPLTNISFNLSFIGVFDGENSTELNVTTFSFVLPFSEDVDRIKFKEKDLIREEINRTPNTPTVNITSPIGGEEYSNELFNITWDSSDLDEDILQYAVLFSLDNGSNYTALIVDHNQTFLEVNSSNLDDCELCKIEVLVTDGMNTNYSTGEPFSIENDLQINNISIIYSNATERLFKFGIKNTFNEILIEDINWSLDLGETTKDSTISMNLVGLGESFVYIYHNYTISENYTIVITVYNDQFVETEILEGVEI